MSKWINVATTTDIPLNSRKVVNIKNTSILIFNLEGDYYAIKNQCTHEDYPLDEGSLENNILTCPYHGAKFCIISGEVKAPPAFIDLDIFEIRIENGWLQINI